MNWSEHLLNGTIILNQKASNLSGKQLAANVHYWGAMSGHRSNKPHQHSFFEVCYILGGQGIYREGDQYFPLEAGCLFLSRPYITHHIQSEQGLDLLFIGFEIEQRNADEACRDIFTKLATTSTVMIPQAEQLPAVQLWFSLLMLANEHQPLFADGVAGLCSSLLTSLERVFNDDSNAKPDTRDSSIAANLVYQAKLYIHDNLSRTLKLVDVANHLHISGRHLSRVFLSELGQSFSSYVRKERIRKAGILLSTTEHSTKEIAELTGFETVHYFTSVFSAEMGMPPAKFKKKFHQH